MCFFNNVPEDFSQVNLDEIGSEATYNHYPVGAFCIFALGVSMDLWLFGWTQNTP